MTYPQNSYEYIRPILDEIIADYDQKYHAHDELNHELEKLQNKIKVLYSLQGLLKAHFNIEEIYDDERF